MSCRCMSAPDPARDSVSTSSLTQEDADAVARLVLQQFDSLPTKGKPQGREWTVLAGIVADCRSCASPRPWPSGMQVVAIGTGTKCLGRSLLVGDGSLVQDCHGEVICRRAFVRFLVAQARACLAGQPSVFELLDAADVAVGSDEQPCLPTFAVRAGIHFHMFVSEPPCGDAAVSAPPQSAADAEGTVHREAADVEAHPAVSGSDPAGTDDWIEDDPTVRRTGARPVGSAVRPFVTGALPCVLRTKPGRGDRTTSMCCSDKLARWGVLGLQGALLALLVAGPVRLASITVGGPGADERALRRALVDRVTPAPGTSTIPALQVLCAPEAQFRHARVAVEAALGQGAGGVAPGGGESAAGGKRKRSGGGGGCGAVPSGTAISWSLPDSHDVTLSGSGRRFGSAASLRAKKRHRMGEPVAPTAEAAAAVAPTAACKAAVAGSDAIQVGVPTSAQSLLCKRAMYTEFLGLVRELHEAHPLQEWARHPPTYAAAKESSRRYAAAWKQLRAAVMRDWVGAPRFVDEFEPS